MVKINSPVFGFVKENEKGSVDSSFMVKPKSFNDFVFEQVFIFCLYESLIAKGFSHLCSLASVTYI